MSNTYMDESSTPLNDTEGQNQNDAQDLIA